MKKKKGSLKQLNFVCVVRFEVEEVKDLNFIL